MSEAYGEKRVEIDPMLKKPAASTEGPEQEDPDAAGVTSCKEIGA
jgi:hypothetical protein